MSLLSRLMARFAKLPRAETYDIAVERNLKVPMQDGIMLLANRYSPRKGGSRPTILMRTPYGRGNFDYIARLFAERGFQVLLQACRGTDGSEGEFDAFRQEHLESKPTVEWIKRQDWFNGDLALYGPSYLGYVQWPIAAEAGQELKALVAQMCSPDIRRAIYPGGSLALDIFLRWAVGVGQGSPSIPVAMKIQRRLKRGCDHLPLRDADVVVSGQPARFWRDVVDHQPDDDWWKAQDYWAQVPQVTVPVQLFSGWYDFFLPDVVRLYEELRRAGRQPHLIVGPWAHGSWQVIQHDVREALPWLRAHLLGDRSGLRDLPVHLYVMGANEWLDYADWPPAEYRPQRWHLQSEHRMAPQAPVASEPDRYRYDPANPTPAVGGIGQVTNFGAKDQRKLEARPDVLTYTSVPLNRDLEAIGHAQVELYVRSSLEHTDFFACLCDVDPSGKSINVSSAIFRAHPGHPAPEADGCLKVCFDLWATAYRFRREHRIRLQVSSGAHPLFARNLGTGESLATATTMRIAEQSIYHDPAHPSAVILPVSV